MVTPVSLLSVFCATMAAISIGRLAIADDVDPVDAGTAVIVVGITALSALWAAIDHSETGSIVRVLLGVGGTALIGFGVVIVAHYWDA